MENLFEHKIHWQVSRQTVRSKVKMEKVEHLSDLSLEGEWYRSSIGWCLSVEALILKPTVGAYFESFFSPMVELLGLVVCWDCEGNVLFSEVTPIYISKENTRKLHGKLQQDVPKHIVGALSVQLFVLEGEGDIETFWTDLSAKKKDFLENLKALLKEKNFKVCADFVAHQLQTLSLSFELHLQELFRANYPSSTLDQQELIKEEKNTLFYNTVIHIQPWKN